MALLGVSLLVFLVSSFSVFGTVSPQTASTEDNENVADKRRKSHRMPDVPEVPEQLVLNGIWYNQLGSFVDLEEAEDGRLTGHYNTGVESTPGAAGYQPSPLSGQSSPDKTVNPTFGFTVAWPRSTSSFTGQYYNQSGVEVLLTTWILTSKVDDISDSWGANRVGQNRFTRTVQVKRNDTLY